MRTNYLSHNSWSRWHRFASQNWTEASETLEYELLMQPTMRQITFNRLLYCYEQLEAWEIIEDYLEITRQSYLKASDSFKIKSGLKSLARQDATKTQIQKFIKNIPRLKDNEAQKNLSCWVINFCVNSAYPDIALEYISKICHENEYQEILACFLNSLNNNGVLEDMDFLNMKNLANGPFKNQLALALYKICCAQGDLKAADANLALSSDENFIAEKRRELEFIADCQNNNYLVALNAAPEFTEFQIQQNPALLDALGRLYMQTGNSDLAYSLLKNNIDFVTKSSLLWFLEYFTEKYGFKNLPLVENSYFKRLVEKLYSVEYFRKNIDAKRTFIIFDNEPARAYYKKNLPGNIIFISLPAPGWLVFLPHLIVDRLKELIKKDQELVIIGSNENGFNAILLSFLLSTRCENRIICVASRPVLSIFPIPMQANTANPIWRQLMAIASCSAFARKSLEKYGNLNLVMNSALPGMGLEICIFTDKCDPLQNALAKLGNKNFIHIGDLRQLESENWLFRNLQDVESGIKGSEDHSPQKGQAADWLKKFFDEAIYEKSMAESIKPPKNLVKDLSASRNSASSGFEAAKPHEIAIITSINDGYVPMLGTMLNSLKRNSFKVFLNSDIIVYHDNLSLENQLLLKKVFPEIKFIDLLTEAQLPRELLDHAAQNSWGHTICGKFGFYDLLKSYRHVLHLDSDMIIKGELDELFSDPDCDIRYIRFNLNVMEVLYGGKHPECVATIPNAGVIYFNQNILKHDLPENFLLENFNIIKDINRYGIDERLIGWLTHRYRFRLSYFPPSFNSFIDWSNDNSQVTHFMSHNSKPWKDPAIYASSPEWGSCHREWLRLSGQENKLFSHEGANLFNSNFVYHTLFNYQAFISLFNELTVRKIPGVSPRFAPNGRYLQFFMDGVPESVHYEVHRSRNSACIGLHVEDSKLISPETIQLFKQLAEKLKPRWPTLNLAEAKTLKLDVPFPGYNPRLADPLHFLITDTINEIRDRFSQSALIGSS